MSVIRPNCYDAFEKEPIKIATRLLRKGATLRLVGKFLFVKDVLFLSSKVILASAQSKPSIDKSCEKQSSQSALNSSLIERCKDNLKSAKSFTPSRLAPLRKKPKIDPELVAELEKKFKINQKENASSAFDDDFDINEEDLAALEEACEIDSDEIADLELPTDSDDEMRGQTTPKPNTRDREKENLPPKTQNSILNPTKPQQANVQNAHKHTETDASRKQKNLNKPQDRTKPQISSSATKSSSNAILANIFTGGSPPPLEFDDIPDDLLDLDEKQDKGPELSPNKRSETSHAASEFDDILELSDFEEELDKSLVELLNSGGEMTIDGCIVLNGRDGGMIFTDGTATAVIRTVGSTKVIQEEFRKRNIEWTPGNFLGSTFTFELSKRKQCGSDLKVELKRIVDIQKPFKS